MLLDASSQRAKSWSCERCHNWIEIRDQDVCRNCFWTFPEHYTNIAVVVQFENFFSFSKTQLI